ncbi:hypothetical protein [Kitasatospora sp. NPDC097643]|uniref:hypothetical protein n=1 Tax=Kitasatospora sp. NPDC097643 TaxID=3157230 RepID=UPI0033296CB9
MRRAATGTTLTAAALIAMAALTGCGSVHADAPTRAGSAVTTASPLATPATTTPEQAEAIARHNRLFPQVAAKCAGVAALPLSAPTDPGATPAATPGGGGGGEQWADKYAENHAYKQTVPLLADAQCRGKAHAGRIADALAKAGRPDTLTETYLRTTLEQLGYPTKDAAVQIVTKDTGTPATFSLWIPGAGPCITGLLSAEADISPHGPYLDGGCAEPKGGH